MLNRSSLSFRNRHKNIALAHGAGLTALHYAARRGDLEIVRLLFQAGADPFVENDLGMNAFDVCDKSGPFPNHSKIFAQILKILSNGG